MKQLYEYVAKINIKAIAGEDAGKITCIEALRMLLQYTVCNVAFKVSMWSRPQAIVFYIESNDNTIHHYI